MATVQEKIDRFHEKLAKIEMGGGQDKIDKQHEKGKQTARERLNKLFDAGSFTEISQFYFVIAVPTLICRKRKYPVTGL